MKEEYHLEMEVYYLCESSLTEFVKNLTTLDLYLHKRD
jgi:hypothetical protein